MKALSRSNPPMRPYPGSGDADAANVPCRRGVASLTVVGSELLAVFAICFAFATSVVLDDNESSSASEAKMERRAHPVREVAIAGQAGNHVAIAWDERCIILDRKTRMQHLAWLKGRDERLTTLAASAVDDLLLLGTSNHGLELLSTTDGRALWHLPVDGLLPTATCFSHDGETVAAALDGGFISIIDVRSGVQRARFQVSPDDLHLIAFSADDCHLLAPTSSNGFAMLSVATGKVERQISLQAGYVTALVASPDGRYIAAGTTQGTTMVWDTISGQEVCRYEGARLPVLSILFQPECESVVISHGGGSISLIPIDQPERTRLIGQHEDSVRSMACHDNLLISGGFDGFVRAWDLESETEATFPNL